MRKNNGPKRLPAQYEMRDQDPEQGGLQHAERALIEVTLPEQHR